MVVKHALQRSGRGYSSGLLTCEPALKQHYRRLYFFYKLRHFMQIGCYSIQIHLRKNSSSSQTNGSRFWSLNMDSLGDTQTNVIQFPKKDCSIRVQDYLKNIWNVRNSFITKFGINPPVRNDDQMSLHRTELSGQATLVSKTMRLLSQKIIIYLRSLLPYLLKLLVIKISSLSQNLCLKTLAKVQQSLCHLQEHTIV